MADVSGNLKDWSTTASSNSPSGATTIGTGLDDNLREIQKVVRQDLAHKGADIASAATTDIGAVAGLMHDITGTTAITSLGTVSAGVWKVLKFEGALTLTHNATSLILPGAANITTADGDVGIFLSEGSGNWRCLSYMKASGNHLGPVLGTVQTSTSGTSVDFTGIPPWAKKVSVCINGLSISGTDNLLIQIGDSGGLETSSYASTSTVQVDAGATDGASSTSGFVVFCGDASDVVTGVVTLVLMNPASNLWVATGVLSRGTARTVLVAGGKALSATLDRVSVKTTGTDTFDAGSVNIMYE